MRQSRRQVQTVREDIMRSTITAFALIGGLLASAPSHAQGTQSPSTGPQQQAAPIVPTAPVGHRQPRQSDLPNNPTGPNATEPAPEQTEPNILDPDGRLERALKSICRGC